MKKIPLTIDMDDVLIQSQLAIRKLYATQFNTEVPGVIRRWNGTDVLDAPEGWIEDAFNSNDLWMFVEVFPGVFKTLEYLKNTGRYYMQICTICKPNNAIQKLKFLNAVGFGEYFDEYHLVVKTGEHVVMGKDFVKGIQIDDNMLNITHNKYGILFEAYGQMPYNSDWDGPIVDGWNQEFIDEVEKMADIYEAENGEE